MQILTAVESGGTALLIEVYRSAGGVQPRSASHWLTAHLALHAVAVFAPSSHRFHFLALGNAGAVYVATSSCETEHRLVTEFVEASIIKNYNQQ